MSQQYQKYNQRIITGIQNMGRHNVSCGSVMQATTFLKKIVFKKHLNILLHQICNYPKKVVSFELSQPAEAIETFAPPTLPLS